MARIGFLINPIAGMGGRVGLKGTDGVVDEALRRGARPVAAIRAGEALAKLAERVRRSPDPPEIHWVTCSGAMGAEALKRAGFADVEIVYHGAHGGTTRQDTMEAVRRMRGAGIDLVLFCGGDGTARDVGSLIGLETPILGIPSGVKMYSGVFGVNPEKTAEIVARFLEGGLAPTLADIVDLDEDRYRMGEWAVRLYRTASTLYEPTRTQAAKMLIAESGEADVKRDIADFLAELIETAPDSLFLLGPGSTVQAVSERLGIDKTVLGIDAVAGGRCVGSDLNERQILALLDRFPRAKLVLSPIGAQGFVLGRGNLQISPSVIERVGRDNLIVVATPAKLARTSALRFDTGSRDLDAGLAGAGYIPVVVGFRRRRLVKILA